jgi:hypothetical protein
VNLPLHQNYPANFKQEDRHSCLFFLFAFSGRTGIIALLNGLITYCRPLSQWVEKSKKQPNPLTPAVNRFTVEL